MDYRDMKLVSEYPYYVDRNGRPYDFSDDVGKGWIDLCIRTFGLIAKAYEEAGEDFNRFSVAQIKEKFGGLRIYLYGTPVAASDAVHKAIAEAERDSYSICEVCGQPGLPRRGGWIKTLCDFHAGVEQYEGQF